MNKQLQHFIESKMFLFFVQTAVLYGLSRIMQYGWAIPFDESTSTVHRDIIQSLANFFLIVAQSSKPLFPYLAWSLAALIPILIYRTAKQAYSLNLLTFFLYNFFFYVFLERYSPDFYYAKVGELLIQTVILGIYLFILSLGVGTALERWGQENKKDIQANLEKLIEENKSICPHCGTKFESTPEYCYNCSKKIKVQNIQDREKETITK